MPRPPLTVYLSLLKWCAPWVEPSKTELRREIERRKSTAHGLTTRFSAADWRREIEHSDCRANIKANRVPGDNPVGASVARVVRRYGQVVVDVFAALAPLVKDGAASPFATVRDWTIDGVHGFYNRQGVSLYVDALGEMLSEVLAAALRAQRRQMTNPGGRSTDLDHHTAGQDEREREDVPPPMELGVGAWGASATPRTLASYGWLSRNLKAPRTLASAKRVAGGRGWFVSEVTLHGAKRKKPGLVSLDQGDSVDLEVATEARGRVRDDGRFSAFCVGLTYLQSYEFMGRVLVTCLAPCVCQQSVTDALDRRRRTSLFHAVELRLSSAAPTCALRLLNLGVRPASSDSLSQPVVSRAANEVGTTPGSAPPPPSSTAHNKAQGARDEPTRATACEVPPCEAPVERPVSKFRLAGIYVAETWIGNASVGDGRAEGHRAATQGQGSRRAGVCMLDARRQDLNDYGDFETPRAWRDGPLADSGLAGVQGNQYCCGMTAQHAIL